MKAIFTRKIVLVLIAVIVSFGALICFMLQGNITPTNHVEFASNQDTHNISRMTNPSQLDPETDSAIETISSAQTKKSSPQKILSAKERKDSLAADDTSYLDLPEAISDTEIGMLLSKAESTQIWKAQDKVTKTWPTYSDVQEKLREELAEKLDLENTTAEELVRIALEYRETFWKAGGCLSRSSYPYAYKARLLLELAHNRNPENMNITDELVETIQSAFPFPLPGGGIERIQRHVTNRETLFALRSEQFTQIKREIEQGREPTWQDFIRACDQGLLLGKNDLEKAKEVVEWQLQQVNRGYWTGYGKRLTNLRNYLSQGKATGFNIYIATKSRFPEEFRFGRRLPSFRGPTPETRGIVLWGAHPEIQINVGESDSI